MENSIKKKVRYEITLLLLIYSLITLILRILGWGSIVFFIDNYLEGYNLGKFLYYCLPLLVCLYSAIKFNPICIVDFYVLLEICHVMLSLASRFIFLGVMSKSDLVFFPSRLLLSLSFLIVAMALLVKVEKSIQLYKSFKVDI